MMTSLVIPPSIQAQLKLCPNTSTFPFLSQQCSEKVFIYRNIQKGVCAAFIYHHLSIKYNIMVYLYTYEWKDEVGWYWKFSIYTHTWSICLHWHSSSATPPRSLRLHLLWSHLTLSITRPRRHLTMWHLLFWRRCGITVAPSDVKLQHLSPCFEPTWRVGDEERAFVLTDSHQSDVCVKRPSEEESS